MSQPQTILHNIRVSKVAAVSQKPNFTGPNGAVYYGIDIVFTDSNRGSLFSTDYKTVAAIKQGDIMQYRLKVKIIYDANGIVTGTTASIDWYQVQLPVDAVKLEKAVEYLGMAAIEAAKIAHAPGLSEGEFKDRAAMVYGWIRDTFLNEKYGLDDDVQAIQ